MQTYKLGSAVDMKARFGNGLVENLKFEVTTPQKQLRTFNYGAADQVLKMLGEGEEGERYQCSFTPDSLGLYTYKVKARVNGHEVFAEDTFEVVPGAVPEQPVQIKEVVTTESMAVDPSPAKSDPVAGATFPQAFIVKNFNGKRRWYGRPTLNTRDREGETVSKAALEEVVARSKAAGFYPPLQFYHIPYNVGVTDDYRVVDGIVVATGEFNDDPVSKAVADYYEQHPESLDGSGWAMSWRFYARPDAERVFNKVERIKEFTFLPFSQAANQDTRFVAERMKMLTKAQQDALDLVLADPALKLQAKQAIDAEVFGKSLDESGAQRKDIKPEEAPPTPAIQPQVKQTEADAEPSQAPVAEALQALTAKGGLKDRPLMISDINIIVKMVDSRALDIVKAVASKKGYVTLDEVNEAFKSRDEYLAEVVKSLDDLKVLDMGVQQQKVYNEVTRLVTDVTEAMQSLQQKQQKLEALDSDFRKQYDEPDIIQQWKAATASVSTLIGEDSDLANAKPHEDERGGVFENVGLRSNGKGH
jgi:hypothetical protein